MGTIRAFLVGMWEFRRSFTIYLADYNLAHAYDKGREFAHWVTFRRFEQ